MGGGCGVDDWGAQMITIYTQVSGVQIGSELANDTEELAYALVQMADSMGLDEMREVADYIHEHDAKNVVAMLETMIEALKGGGK